MDDEYEFLMPDYFTDFCCKMGACRAACCEGWPISFTMTDYFKLLGLDCSPELRRKLDCAMHLAEHPSPEAYAQIAPGYDGQCPMRMRDGRCALHAELGEGVLSAVCRLYPRGIRTGEVHECSCTNSCEAVLEMLMQRMEPIRWIRHRMHAAVPEAPARQFHFETAGREQQIRLWLISLVQDRERSLPQRLIVLGGAMSAMADALLRRDHRRVDALLSGRERLPAANAVDAGRDQLRFGLDVANRMIGILDERSDSVRAYGSAALAYFGEGESEFIQYEKARRQFEALLPDWEIWFENMLVNHMFFVQFPFQDRPVDLQEEHMALCAVYALLRFLCFGWTAEHADVSAAVDVAAAAFRLVDHTEFDRYAVPILTGLGCSDGKHLSRLLCL